MLAWPVCAGTWPGRFAQVKPAFARLVLTIADCEPVILLARDETTREEIVQQIGIRDNVSIVTIPVNDSWIRDYGPISVRDGDQSLLVDFRFNAWGGKYPPWNDDDQVAKRLADELGMPLETVNAVLEGGAIEGNGAGLLLATRRSVIDPRRNAKLVQSDYERLLREHLGIDNVCWLEDGELAGDDTDGHIDQLIRFIDTRWLVVASANDATDSNHRPLAQMKKELAASLSCHGSFDLIDLPVPRDVTFRGRRLPASYCNFLFVDGAVIVPVFHDRHDDAALAILRDAMVSRTIVPVPCRELVWGLGAVHCLTQTLA